MRFYKFWEIVTSDAPWIGIVDGYGAIHATPNNDNKTHEQIWPTNYKRWRYRPGSGMVTLWWAADEEEKDHIDQWLSSHGSKANNFIQAY